MLTVYHLAMKPFSDYERRDRILAPQAAAILVVQLVSWLGIFLAGFTLVLWPCNGRSITAALTDAGSSIFTLPDLYRRWERWSADVAESHTTYLPLVRFRSPLPYSSWVVSLLAVLDSAALILSLAPEEAPTVPARLCLRGGFQCLSRIARAMSLDVPEEADPKPASP